MGSGIIPIVLSGTEKTFNKGSWILKGRAKIQIRILDEIPAEEVIKLEIREVISLVRGMMEHGLSQLENERL